VFAGSRIISVKQAENFHAALGHCLKYPCKFITRVARPRVLQISSGAFTGRVVFRPSALSTLCRRTRRISQVMGLSALDVERRC
jgi:hypothetical protein